LPYNNLLSRTDAAAMVPEEVSQQMLNELPNESAVMQLSTRIPISRNQVRFPVLSALPVAYFVTGDTGLKQTTEAAWTNKYLNVEEIATIVPIPEAVLGDAGFDIFGAIRPLMVRAIARVLDAAVIFGTNAPASWPTNIVAGAAAAANTVARGTATQANGGVAADLVNLFATLWADGYDASGVIANTTFRANVLNGRNTLGDKYADMISATMVNGAPVTYPMRGLWPSGTGTVQAVAGDFNNLVLGVRQDMTFKLLDQAVIQDASGNIVYNLAQQDMVALRLVFRAGWQVSNPINSDQPTEASRYPFATLTNP
jgi:HK97 family phage major capsid protein